MRVVVAYDGSRAADIAVDLAGALAWPDGTEIRIVEVLPPLSLFAGAARSVAAVDDLAETSLARAVERCRREGLVVESRLVRGDSPAEAVVLEARQFGADMVITGHRGHGAVASVFLGSVARDIAEHAGCPVLVARRPACEHIVFAEDGSEGAFHARLALASWPMFKGKTVDVVSVVQVARPMLSGITVGVREQVAAAQEELEMEARVAYRRLAGDAADQLRVAGLRATATELRAGDPAEHITAVARERHADLIVLGTRGRGSVARVLLGSIARAVLLAAPCSVLVVRKG